MGKRMEELFYELYASSKQHDSRHRYAMIVELRALMKQPIRGSSGSDHFERALDDEELVETEVATELIGIEDGPVKREANLEEESMPQFQVPIANSEILKSSEPGKVDLGLEKLEHVVINENLAQDWVQKNVKVRFEADGDVENDQKVISNTNICCAHKVFGKMSQHQEGLGIKKKKKGFKSWMFKYKKGNKKHDLLLVNGKYSLPRRAIGSKLETGEIVLSNQERNELCTENKEEVKGCLDRLPASVLMEEEPDSMRVHEVKLENKMTWTELKVKKHDNLSWKEDESRSICCILKLGGVAITCKNVLEKIYDEKLEIVACQLRQAMMESLVPNKFIRKDGSKRHGRSEVSYDVDYLEDHESSSFKESVVASTDLSSVTKIIDSGFVHVLHRDAVLDNMLGCTILSGGVIICHFVDHLKPECVVFFAKEASGKLEQFSGLCKELMDIDVSLDMTYKTQYTKFMKKSTACCCKQVYASFYVWMMLNSLVIQRVMRDRKIRLSKRWWFKYRFDEEDQRKLQSRTGIAYQGGKY